MVGQESLLKEARRIVVKVGSALVTNDGRGLDVRAIERWAGQIAALRAMGREVLLVSSGAIAEGVLRIGWETRPTRVCELQAAAAVGQMGLAQAYEEHFGRHGIKTAQVLLTHANLADREQYLNARMTLIELLGLGIVPVINENDTVVTEEIKVGDNDTLGALVTNLVEADVLVILTDQRGLFTADPRSNPDAEFVQFAQAGDPALEKMAGGAASTLSKGGMITKIKAARVLMVAGIPLVVCDGHRAEAIVDALRAPAYAIAPDAPHTQTMARVELPIWTVDEAQYQQAKEYLARLAAKEIPDDAVTHATALAAVKRYEYGQETYPVPLHAVRLGNVALLTNPFELYQEYADRMRMALKDVHVFDVQLADDALGYLPTQKAVDGGGYSAGLFSCLFGQQGGDALVRHSVALVESLF